MRVPLALAFTTRLDTMSIFGRRITDPPMEPHTPFPTEEWHKVKASSFADPADLAAFKKCKLTGRTDKQCFAVGDNGIGLWGDSTIEGTGPSCALHPIYWQEFYHTARRKKVIVIANGGQIICELKDTCGVRNRIDLNPDAVRALGLEPPILINARWRWA